MTIFMTILEFLLKNAGTIVVLIFLTVGLYGVWIIQKVNSGELDI